VAGTAPSHHVIDSTWIGTKFHAPLRRVRARQIQLIPIVPGKIIEPTNDLGVFLGRESDHIDQYPPRQLQRCKRRQHGVTNCIHSGIGESYGVEHAAAKFGDPRRRIAISWRERHRLGHQPTKPFKPHDATQLDTVPGSTGGQQDRIGETQPGDRGRERHCSPRLVAVAKRSPR
jgi:hypothetical protein